MTTEQNESRQMNIRRGSYDSLEIYEITKDELEILRQGSPNSIFFNFSISLYSIFICLGATLLTVSISNDRVFYVFVIILVVSFIIATITSILWVKSENIFKTTIKRIESRIQEKEYKIEEDTISEKDSNNC